MITTQIKSSIKLKWENLTEVPHDFIRRVVGEEFTTITRNELNFAQLKQIYRYNIVDGYVWVLGQPGQLFIFNGMAVLLLSDGRLFAATIKHYYR